MEGPAAFPGDQVFDLARPAPLLVEVAADGEG
jgi:hypothetical protein